MAATKTPTEDENVGEKWSKMKCSTPDWGVDAKNGDHLWCRSSASGDLCYVGNNVCVDRGHRLKCSSCKIIVHTECLSILLDKMKVLCRNTFQDAENGAYREKTDIPHHWIARRTPKGRCRTCSKTFGGKVCSLLNFMKISLLGACTSNTISDSTFDIPGLYVDKLSLQETIAMSCSWCKEVCHNKESCYNLKKMSSESCNLGEHNKLIVPPTWIVKMPRQETENTKQVFAVKPIPSTSSTPLLVFINPKSGGNQGSKLLRTFQWLLNPRQVFDLTEGGPGIGLELYKRVPNLRILACGGDGTVGWILSVLDDLKVCASPPIAVLPLGTGNDLARSLGWGGGYTDEPLTKILTNVEDGEIVKLDRWILNVSPNAKADSNSNEEGRKNLPLTVVNNYFSLGVDARIALEFHEAREARPGKFNSRFRNKMFYGQAGGKDLIQRKWKDLCNYVSLECDGQDMTGKLKELKVHSILFLNISSYGGGTKPWGSSGFNQFQIPRTDDGLIEVIGLTTYQLPLLQAGGHGTPIAQCRRAKLITSCTIPVQVDGEPCRLSPSVIDIDLLNTVNMIARTKKHGTSLKKENVEKISLPLKLICLLKYEAEHHRKTALKDGSLDFGNISISYNTDLSEIRPQITKLLEEADSGKPEDTANKSEDPETGKDIESCTKVANWWFLDSCSGEKFFRIDEAQEHLYYVNDICDEELYIAEQRESADDVTNDATKVEPDGDDVSRVSTSSSSRQSQESGDDRETEDANSRTEQEGVKQATETSPSTPDSLESAKQIVTDPGKAAEISLLLKESEQISPLRRKLSTPVDLQIVVESDSEMADTELDDNEDTEEKPADSKEMLFVPDRKMSIASLKINESDMDLITAAKMGNLNRVAKLHSGGNALTDRDRDGRTALHHAAFIGNIDVVRYLAAYAPISVLDAQDDIMYHTALHRAATRRDKLVCSILVSAGASLDIKDKQGYTAQQLAEIVGDKKLAEYLESVAESVIL